MEVHFKGNLFLYPNVNAENFKQKRIHFLLPPKIQKSYINLAKLSMIMELAMPLDLCQKKKKKKEPILHLLRISSD